MRRLVLLILISILPMATQHPACGATVNLLVADARFSDTSNYTYPDKSNGYVAFDASSWYMDINSSQYYSGGGGPRGMYYYDNRGVLEIDFTSIAPGSIVNSVELTMWGKHIGGPYSSYASLYGHVGDGVLSVDDVIGSPWPISGGIAALGSFEDSTGPWTPSTTLATVTYTISNSFIEDVINSTGFAAFQLIDLGTTANSGVRFYTNEYSIEAQRPTLTIDYEPATTVVPEPTSLALWSGLGAMGLVAARRKRRHAA